MAGGVAHGGRLAAAQADHPLAPRPWLDLSTGINPHGWRGGRAAFSALRRLPDPADLAALEAAAAKAFGVGADRVAATAGAEAALRLLPSLIGASRVAVASPAYGSHADAWALAGATVQPASRVDLFASDAEALVIVNPNNPDGAATPGAELVAAAAGRWLIIDESFVETAPEISAAALADDRTVVLRSFGKFYGLPGVRLGFVIGAPAVAAAVRRCVGDWPVGADAIALGRDAYAAPAWADRTRARLARDATRLDAVLQGAGFAIVGGTSLFRLARCDDAAGRARRLAEQGVLVRTFDHDPRLIRFGLPQRGRWRRLETALERSR